MRFESGYTVETVFDGSKLGIEPYAVEIAPTGDLLVLDSVNSNIYRIPPSLSRCLHFFSFFFFLSGIIPLLLSDENPHAQIPGPSSLQVRPRGTLDMSMGSHGKQG